MKENPLVSVIIPSYNSSQYLLQCLDAIKSSYYTNYEISEVIAYLNTIENLFLIGRNGMHRYNNQDHSMMSAMAAVDNVMKGITRKDNLWKINVEEEYHEEIHNEECRRL
jgi:cellulose synthase/poly-beta-1,6-N-acetylglucosamine synthase-like glycosyltransferase